MNITTLVPAQTITMTQLVSGGEPLSVLTADRNTIVISSVATGPAGVAGLTGDASVTFNAGAAIGGHRLVRLLSGTLAYMDSSQPTDANMALGVSRHSASLGQPVSVQCSGLITEPSWTWTPDQPVFCGVNGLLTQTAPTSGFLLVVGVAVSATSLFIAIKIPLTLQ